MEMNAMPERLDSTEFRQLGLHDQLEYLLNLIDFEDVQASDLASFSLTFHLKADSSLMIRSRYTLKNVPDTRENCHLVEFHK